MSLFPVSRFNSCTRSSLKKKVSSGRESNMEYISILFLPRISMIKRSQLSGFLPEEGRTLYPFSLIFLKLRGRLQTLVWEAWCKKGILEILKLWKGVLKKNHANFAILFSMFSVGLTPLYFPCGKKGLWKIWGSKRGVLKFFRAFFASGPPVFINGP